jgi:hypothetical protein
MRVIAARRHHGGFRSMVEPSRSRRCSTHLAPDHRYFKIRGDDGALYILRNDVVTGRWELTMLDRTGAIG